MKFISTSKFSSYIILVVVNRIGRLYTYLKTQLLHKDYDAHVLDEKTEAQTEKLLAPGHTAKGWSYNLTNSLADSTIPILNSKL